MSILMKCNATDLLADGPISIRAEKQVKPTLGDEVFVWTSELPREKPRGIGLKALGSLASWQRSGANVTLEVEINNRPPNAPLGMQNLARMAETRVVARDLYERIHRS